jgi:hypothetical protein
LAENGKRFWLPIKKKIKMEKNDLVKLLNEIFVPLNFKRKGINWVLNSDELSKLINLQKSNYSNSFYINYGYIIKDLELTTTTHVENRLASTSKDEQKRITDLLDLETQIPKEQRLADLKKIITGKIVVPMQSVNTVADLLNDVKKQPHFNNIPLIVKRFFDLPE